jgi:flavin reductase (DIM6/NTAB) family NADH-FMN oxidoreductase RutF
MVTTDDWKEFFSPTPVGLVVVADGDYVNVGPGTWIQKVSYNPPIVMVSRKLGSDTDRLLSRRLPFVLSMPPLGYEEDVLQCSRPLPYGESELALPQVGFEIGCREGDRVFLEPMISHAVCTVVDPIVTIGDHRVFFAEVTELRDGTEPRHPSNTMLHHKAKVFAAVGPLRLCAGW